MNPRFTLRLSLMSLVVAVGLIMSASPRAEAQRVPSPTVGDSQTDAAWQMINNADPAVVPTLLQWLDEAVTHPKLTQRREHILAALRGVAVLRVEEAGPTLVAIYQNPDTPRWMKDSIADAAAAIHSAPAKRFLQSIAHDEGMRTRSRMQVLGALVQLDDSAARAELLDAYKNYLTVRPVTDGEASWAKLIMDGLDDAALLEQVKQFRDAQTNIDAIDAANDTIARMTINRMPAAELLNIAQETDWKRGAPRRLAAIDALAVKGGVDTIPLVEQLAPFTNVPVESLDSVQRGFNVVRQRAVFRLRCTHAREHSATAGAATSQSAQQPSQP
jgi:hypothetical protein